VSGTPAARVAALYDIHGNLPALEAVLDEVRGLDVDRVVVGGDVLPGPMLRECLARLTSLDVPVQWLKGNGEVAVLAMRTGGDTSRLPPQAVEAVKWSAEQLGEEDVRFIAEWPATQTVDVDGLGEVLFCHATPRNENEIFTRMTPAELLVPVFSTVTAPIVVCGHTHMQFDRVVGPTRVVNAGSVGMPFGEPGSYWLLLGSGVELRRTDYDLEAAAAQIRGSVYPQAGFFAERSVLRPPSEAEMLALYERAELK
jgi:predicted phosphodiesterase